MDVEDIAPGQLFARKIDETIAGCDIALIVIGPRWADIMRERAQREQLDYVRHEVESALARQITVVPVLVGGASIGELSGLPDQLSGLSQYEAAELRDGTFSDDCARLAKSLDLEPIADGTPGNKKAKPAFKIAVGAGLAAVLLLAALGWMGMGRQVNTVPRQAAIRQMFVTAKTQLKDRSESESAPSEPTHFFLRRQIRGIELPWNGKRDAAMGWLRRTFM